MISILLPLALLAQAAPETAPIASLDQLPVEQATGPRCGLAFAIVAGWQKAGDPRGEPYADMESEGGREFFVRSIADLMDQTGMTREQVSSLIRTEAAMLGTPEGAERVEAMMPACLLLKEASGL